MIKKFYILSIGIASLSTEMKSSIGLHFSDFNFSSFNSLHSHSSYQGEKVQSLGKVLPFMTKVPKWLTLKTRIPKKKAYKEGEERAEPENEL